METLRQSLRGIVPPLITPLLVVQGKLSIDEEGTRRLVERLIDGGVSALFVFGSTGEGPSLCQSLRHNFVRLVCQLVRKQQQQQQQQLPVLVGIIGTCLEEMKQDATAYQQAGADALVLTAPYYFSVSQTELVDWCWQVYSTTTTCDNNMPLILYNMPGLTKIWFDIETVETLLARDAAANPANPRIIGIKDSSANLEYFGKLCSIIKTKFPHVAVLMGPEHLTVQAMELGADGIVPGGANAFAPWFVALHQACVQLLHVRQNEKEESKIKAAERRVSELAKPIDELQAIYKGVNWIVATKIACELEGLCSSSLAPPFTTSADDSTKATIRDILDKAKAVLPKADDC